VPFSFIKPNQCASESDLTKKRWREATTIGGAH
jgi:hypothetical protein